MASDEWIPRILQYVRSKLGAFKERTHQHEKALHSTHNWAHLLYFGAVWVEGHGFYAMMGGSLLIIGLVMLLVDGEVD